MPRKSKKSVDLAIAYKQAFGSEHGQMVLNDILSVGHVFHTSYDPKSQYETAFREGERNMALRILAFVEQDIEKLRQMLKQREQEEMAHE